MRRRAAVAQRDVAAQLGSQTVVKRHAIVARSCERLWRSGRQALPPFPPGTRFSPAAQDFLKDHGLTIRFEVPVPEPTPLPATPASAVLPAAYLLARLDSLHALALLAAAEARTNRLFALAALLDPLAAEVLALHTAAAYGGPLPPPPPDPADAPAFERPTPHDHMILHWLNLLRATAHEAEVLAASQAPALAPAIAQHLHRLGHTLAELAAGFRSGDLAWPAA